MNPTAIRILFAIFLIAHGWIHLSLTLVPIPAPGAPRTPFFPAWWREAIDTNWPVIKLGLAPRASRIFGSVLWALVLAGYTLAGASLLFAPAQTALWQGFTAGASILSLLFLALFWHPWLPAGVLIDLALLAAIYLHWPILNFAK
jgi:hypothetical protein